MLRWLPGFVFLFVLLFRKILLLVFARRKYQHNMATSSDTPSPSTPLLSRQPQAAAQPALPTPPDAPTSLAIHAKLRLRKLRKAIKLMLLRFNGNVLNIEFFQLLYGTMCKLAMVLQVIGGASFAFEDTFESRYLLPIVCRNDANTTVLEAAQLCLRSDAPAADSLWSLTLGFLVSGAAYATYKYSVMSAPEIRRVLEKAAATICDDDEAYYSACYFPNYADDDDGLDFIPPELTPEERAEIVGAAAITEKLSHVFFCNVALLLSAAVTLAFVYIRLCRDNVIFNCTVLAQILHCQVPPPSDNCRVVLFGVAFGFLLLARLFYWIAETKLSTTIAEAKIKIGIINFSQLPH